MAAPDIDPNQWYNIHVNNDTDSSLQGTVLYGPPNATGTLKGSRGAVFMKTTDGTSNLQKWQIYPLTVNNTIVYALRSKEASSKAFMATSLSNTEAEEGHTQPSMVRGDVADDSVYWTFGKWGSDESWFLTNAVNGTKYHLNKNSSNTLMNMSPNMTAPDYQKWSVESIGRINDKAFSTVSVSTQIETEVLVVNKKLTTAKQLPGLTVTAPPSTTSSSSTPNTASATSTPTASPSSTTVPPPTGLSTGAKAGIGAAVGGAALIALLLLALFLLRRRKNATREPPPYEVGNTEHV
jgi:LPXTG-motif cell wall-anchored protein